MLFLGDIDRQQRCPGPGGEQNGTGLGVGVFSGEETLVPSGKSSNLQSSFSTLMAIRIHPSSGMWNNSSLAMIRKGIVIATIHRTIGGWLAATGPSGMFPAHHPAPDETGKHTARTGCGRAGPWPFAQKFILDLFTVCCFTHGQSSRITLMSTSRLCSKSSNVVSTSRASSARRRARPFGWSRSRPAPARPQHLVRRASIPLLPAVSARTALRSGLRVGGQDEF